MLNKKYIFILIILIFNNILSAMKLSELEGVKKLSNYTEIKDIDVERIVDYDNYDRNKEKNRVYVKGETIPFTGIGIEKKNNKITGITIYKGGKSEGPHYRYYENGQLYIKIQQKNDKTEGEGFEYYPNGKLRDKRIYKNGVIVEATDYYQNGKIDRTFKSTEGLKGIITGYYEDGIHKNSEMSVIQDYSKKGTIKYIMDGESKAYDKQGRLMGIVNYKNGKMYGLPQKLFKNGNLKYEYVAASEKGGSDFEAMTYFKEYFDNSDKLKLDCDEQSKGKWHCKEYNKNGSLKNEFTSPIYALEIKRGTNYWLNVFLGVWNILMQ